MTRVCFQALVMTAALESITHSTEEFVSSVLGLCVFLLPVFLYARVAIPVPQASGVPGANLAMLRRG